MSREAFVQRNTKETEISLELRLEGKGSFEGSSGIGFFNHLLEMLIRHALFDFRLSCTGDLFVDGHHTVEDIGLVLGESFNQALGERKNIQRYGFIILPMDEALVLVALDLVHRPFLNYDINLSSPKVGDFEVELAEEFLRAFISSAAFTLHIHQISGKNTHHILEAVFKGIGRALRMACAIDPLEPDIPSTKGVL